MANDATLVLKLDLAALNAGFKAALQMGQNFAGQLNKVLAGKGMIDLDSFDRQLKSYEQKLKSASGGKLELDAKPAVSALGEVKSAAEKSGTAIRQENLQNAASFAQVVTGINSFMSIMDRFGSAISSTKNTLFGAAADFEQLKLRLIAMYGSVEKGTEVFNDFKKAAKTTPATLMEVVEAGAQMKAFGMDAQRHLQGVIDVAAYMGLTVVEAANSVGRGFAGGVGAADVLRERGVLTLIKLKTGIDDLTKMSLPEFQEALVTAFTDSSYGISGTAKTMVNSLTGAESIFKDTLTNLRAQFGENIIPGIAKFLLKLTETIDKITEWAKATDGLRGILVVLLTTLTPFVTFIAVYKGVALATKAWALAQAALNAVMNANPIFLIITLIATLVVAIYGLYHTNEKFAQGFDMVWRKGVAAFKIVWEYIKGFWAFIKGFGTAIAMTLALPYKIMYDTAKEIFGKLGRIMKKLLVGDFKGVWAEITTGIKTNAADGARAVIEQYGKAFDTLDGLGEKAKQIWEEAGVAREQAGKAEATGATPKVTPKTTGGETPEQKAAREKLEQARATAVENYYSLLKWSAADYEAYMTKKYESERDAYEILTGDKEQAAAIYTERMKALEADRASYEQGLREESIKAERAPFEAAKTAIEEHLARLENWKQLGLNVTQDLKKTWDDYFNLLKARNEESEQQYEDAVSGKIQVSEEELVRLKSIYESDKDNYLSALDKKHQADLKAADDILRKWRENNQGTMQVIGGIRSGFNTMWDSILDKTMTGRERMNAIWQSMLNSWIGSLGKFVGEYLEKELMLTAIHTAQETTKTGVTAANEAVRTTAHRASVLEQVALDIWSGIKFVAIKLWETAAALTRFYAFLGPLAPVAAGATMAAGVIPLIAAFRKGFKTGAYTGDGDENEIAGAVHRGEFVFPAWATKSNLKELWGLMGLLKKGYKLKNLIPGVSIPWQPVPQVAYSFAGGGQGSGNMPAMVRQAVRDELINLRLSAEIAPNDKIRIWLSRQAEKGSKLRRVLG